MGEIINGIATPYERLNLTSREALAFSSGDTVKSFTMNESSASTHTIILEMPDFSGAVVTGTLSIENANGTEIYSNPGLAENTVHVMSVEKPLIGLPTIKVTLSTNPLSSGTCHVSMYIKKGG